MKKPDFLPYYFEWSTVYPHIAAMEFGDGVAFEVAVMSIDNRNGDVYFIRLDQLDKIDISRLQQIITSRDSHRYPLWDLLSQKTLPNGMNALEFFQQMVKFKTVTGKILSPNEGARGVTGMRSIPRTTPKDLGQKVESTSESEGDLSDTEYLDIGDEFAPRKRAGRPRKSE